MLGTVDWLAVLLWTGLPELSTIGTCPSSAQSFFEIYFPLPNINGQESNLNAAKEPLRLQICMELKVVVGKAGTTCLLVEQTGSNVAPPKYQLLAGGPGHNMSS